MIDLAPPPLWLPPQPAIIRSAHDLRPPNIAMLPGIAPLLVSGAPPAAPVDVTVTQALTIHPVETQTVTWSGVAFGAAAPNRYVFLAVPYYTLGTAGASISAGTIGGVTATIVASPGRGGSATGGFSIGVAIVYALVPTGTSGTVTLTLATNTTFRPRICVYRVVNLQSTAPVQLLSANNIDATAPLSRSVSATKDGFTMIVCAVYGNSTTRTLSGLTQDYTVSPVASMQFIGGSIENASSGTVTGTVTGGTTGNWCVAMASFR